ncbi:DUF4261 domain-containing protein [Actinomadura graeca]|uniref:DUF4261 domain-containing protein n=1 Tax=Actinomadura graeca TaxID=2750812 RepID=A0ABX8QNI1_9ACTN|nr:DUF4261 domain-containing protein [Actinomadura graeca]QXJ20252.1 DUF4261 domain-containing protein [Actinomadura graeca]
MIDDQTLMSSRHVLCVLGTGLDLGAVEATAAKEGFGLDWEYSAAEPDPRMGEAFEACAARVSFTAADWDAVESHDTVAYVLSPPVLPDVAFTVARRTLVLAADLLRSGATAVKNESNGLTHGRDRWLDLAAGIYDGSPDDSAIPLYRALVKRPISDGPLHYSCGMHLLGSPDVELDPGEGLEPEDVAGLIDSLALYLLTECRAGEIEDGEGFRSAPGEPRWILGHRPCDRYDEDDIFFNPHGYLRMTPG